jgi:tetratricopeptide (TPR) repeat protein
MIGRYRVVRLLGEGGMGSVYEAEQDRPRRVVALKVIKSGFATAEALRRFQHESQALGRLQHPGIAQIYEASTNDTGFGPQPYFAMELVRGCPLHEYAEAHQLNARERLALMAKVCDAVDHAHERGVIHRDLKPGNILVDEAGQPKILDFGVARLTESDTQLTCQTDLGQVVGTLAYMSPEQLAGDPLALDIRCDVYALGVTLYELLAGKLPYNIDHKPLNEAVEVIREVEPARLCSIQRSYRGDIDTIVAKALEKDKGRRYASAAELAGDIRRYLADEPITARPASAGYQLQKFARRHKALVAGTAAVFLVLAAGVVGSTLEAVRARRAELVAEAINDFLRNDVLAQASADNQSGPSTKPDPDLKVRTALDRAAVRLAGKFDRQPEVEAAIRDTIGQTYFELGQAGDARKQLERALELQRRALGADNPQTLKTMDHLGRVVLDGDKPAQAELLFGETLRIRRRVLGPEHPDTLRSMRGLARAYNDQDKYAQAEALDTQILQISRRVLGPEHPDTLSSMNGLAWDYVPQGKHAKAELLFRQVAEISRRVLGPEHPATLGNMMNVAIEYKAQGKYPQAEALESEILEMQRHALGPQHRDTLKCMNNLAETYFLLGKYANAETLFSQIVDITHGKVPAFTENLAETYGWLGKYPQAEALFGETLEAMSRRGLGPGNDWSTLSGMAFMYQRQGKYALAESRAAQVLASQRRILGSEHPDTMASAADLALAYLSQGKFAESEPLAREAVAFCRRKEADDWPRFRAESLMGAALSGKKNYAEAEPLLLEGYQGMVARRDRIAIPYRYHLDRAHDWVVQLYEAWGKPEKAADWKEK